LTTRIDDHCRVISLYQYIVPQFLTTVRTGFYCQTGRAERKSTRTFNRITSQCADSLHSEDLRCVQREFAMHTNNYQPTTICCTLRRKRDSFSAVATFAVAIIVGGALWQNNCAGQVFSSVLISLPIVYAIASLIATLHFKARTRLIATVSIAAFAIFTAIHITLSTSAF
jgi:hypothetical protein